MSLYRCIESARDLNIIIIISILIISIYLYRISKDILFFNISGIYFVKLCIFYFISRPNILEIYSVSTLWLVFFILTISLPVHVLIIKGFIINKIKELAKSVEKKNNKLKSKQVQIKKYIEEIDKECILQNMYKDEITYLNERIIRSVDEVNMPIFILNAKREYIYSNNSFNKLAKLNYEIDNNFNIDIFTNSTFINGEDMIDAIVNANGDLNKSINLEGYDNKIYRLTCITDTIEDNGIILCILNDITNSTLIKNKLEESEAKYRNLMDILIDGVIIHDKKSVSYINNKAKELFDIQDKKSEAISIGEIKNNIKKKFKLEFLKNINLIQSEEEEKTVTKIETKNGKILEVITNKLDINNNKMMLSLVIDVTNLENAMEELEQSEKTYKLLVKTLPEGIMIVDKNNKNHIYKNKAMIEILKYVGVDKLNEFIKDSISKGDFGRFIRFSTDKSRELNISLAIIYMEKDDNFLVVARTLQSEIYAEKMAEKLSEVKRKYRFNTEFLTNVTKDLKKPINTISKVNNILDINKGKYNSKHVDNYTRLVKQNCYRLTRLLNNIDYIDKLDNNKLDVELKRCDVVKFTKNILNLAREYTEAKQLKLHFKSSGKKIFIDIDKEKFESILLNLLSNSIKFTNQGGEIEVSIELVDEKVVLYVKDTGVGIPKDKVDMIFENFEQIDRTLSRGAEGTGVGLSLVKKLVDIHDGKIAVTSNVGIGSKFVITFNKAAENSVEENKLSSTNVCADKEKMDIEFSDIYFNLDC